MAALLFPAPAQAMERVSIEIVLAVDVSLSVNDIEYQLQMSGIANALIDPEVTGLIGGHEHGIAITLTQWTGTYESNVPLPWRRIKESDSVTRLAEEIRTMPRSEFGNFTAIGHAINFAIKLIETNHFDGDEKKIDVSGDGRNNSGPEPREARETAKAFGITINGLAITNSEPQLASYYASHVIIGPESFVVTADDFESFGEAFKRKLKRELSPKVSRAPGGMEHALLP
jgi:hypothetical protein